MKRITQFFVLLLISTFVLAVPHPSKPWVEINYPQDKEKRWWDDAWWKEGQLPVPQNHKVSMESVTYMDGDVEVEAYLFKPTKPGKYLPVLFQHGRRGLDSWTLPRVKRLAARGFIVLAPDMFGTYMNLIILLNINIFTMNTWQKVLILYYSEPIFWETGRALFLILEVVT